MGSESPEGITNSMKAILIYSLLLLPLVGWGQDFISQLPTLINIKATNGCWHR